MTRRTRLCLTLFLSLILIQVIEFKAFSATRYIDPLCGEINTYNPAGVGTARCSGGTATSKPSFVGSIAIMAPGDILYVRGSLTSTPTVYTNRIANPPSGTGASGRTVISAYPINRTCSGHNPADVTTCIGSTYENVLLKPTAAPVVDIRGTGASPGPKRDPKWITIEGIRVDASSSGGKGITVTGGGSSATNPPACDNFSKDFDTTPDHLRFLNMEVFGSPSSAYLGDLYNEHMEIIGNYIHDNGSDLGKDHGLYYGGSDGLIYGNILEHNRTYGLHLYGQADGTFSAPVCDPFPSGNIVEANIARGNRNGLGILASHRNTIVRNNLTYGNTESGIHVTSSNGGQHKIYNNTSINNGTEGLNIGEFGHNTIIKNNIFDRLFKHAKVTGVVESNNYNCGDTCTDNTAFVDAAAAVPDLRLRPGDARIDAGANLTSEGVTKDFAGNARPQGAGFDIGAYEAGTGTTQTFDFSVATDVDADLGLTIPQGASADVTVTATKLAGTAAELTFTATGLPTNTTLSFAPLTCTPTPTSCTTEATVTVPNTTPQGTYVVSVRASTGGGTPLVRSAAFTLHITCN